MSTNSAQTGATQSQATQSQATQSQTAQAQTNTTEPAPVRGTTVNKSQGGRRLENYLPPEGVPIAFDISGGGARLGAQFLDILITFGGVILLLFLLLWSNILGWSAFLILLSLLFFFVRVPYYVLSELVWNGRTLGKRLVKIRVISADGTRLSPYQITARNLMKEIEVFTPIAMIFSVPDKPGYATALLMLWVVVVLLVPFFNKRRQRLGDMIAGTLVVDQPLTLLLPDLAQTATETRAKPRYLFDPSHLGIYGRFELQTLEQILRSPPQSPEQRNNVSSVTKTILTKIDYPETVNPNDQWQFLTDFYTAQREFLESRQLFGDARENKFHDVAKTAKTGADARFTPPK